jgi:hypothetical protein
MTGGYVEYLSLNILNKHEKYNVGYMNGTHNGKVVWTKLGTEILHRKLFEEFKYGSIKSSITPSLYEDQIGLQFSQESFVIKPWCMILNRGHIKSSTFI